MHIPIDVMVEDLGTLCAQPSSTRQRYDLADSARLVATMLRNAGLDARIIQSGGAPAVIGQRAGLNQATLLLYHHYDVAPPGPWHDWSHTPFQLAEREEKLYARGVAHGKGPLVAHLQALQTLLRLEGELPCNVIMVIEGERLIGSPNLRRIVKKHLANWTVDACLSCGGERDANGAPFCYSGSKGLLQVKLTATGARVPLESGLATSLHNPLWRLIWALSSIKGEDEDIRFNGFYDDVDGPERGQREMLRKVKLDEAGRLNSWHIPEFLFGMKGASLLRTEVTLPTCHVSSLVSEPPSEVSSIPTSATALLEFQLVPQQQPDTILELLQRHLASRDFAAVKIERLPGHYPPIVTPMEHPFIQQLTQVGEHIYHTPLSVLPFGTFTQPLHTFAHLLQTPVAALGFARHNSNIYGTNENLPREDLEHHAQFLIELLLNYGERVRHVAW
jgi:acetylornithine deacetylase/succinyl-diaminopimelate desuccinylase-like protein